MEIENGAKVEVVEYGGRVLKGRVLAIKGNRVWLRFASVSSA